ncbi:type II toxin-antitoxin system VapC family toxin [Rivularia sp. UHCC 0363]|uniref:type II toxin-antitoxin system VapC family toxin n=1 Tax=Rivularia sp. UHCC 0363 TaxID=3110244 RepID=UPI002B21809E|nr:type II toxin-antitoxin system VapC family toxin [Rivularia sp. UHCC 0363]MEA5594631.1 type II toxin-antitoxin system VapC family toxin [Rivularia sp. UHCC 0363]
MSGKRYLLDTNAIVALLKGSPALVTLLQNAEWVGISIISQIEFLAFSGLSESDRNLFKEFLKRVEVIDLAASNDLFIEQIIQIRLQYRVKLPDAIIASTALQVGASLVTADNELTKVTSLTIVNW